MLPVFLLLTLVVVDGARAYIAQISLVNGVREATLFAIQGGYNSWCRSGGGEPTVPCPAGAGDDNYADDPANLAYRIAGETAGIDRSRITLFPPRCGLGPGAPAQSCDDVPQPQYVEVRAQYPFDPITPGLQEIWGSTIIIEAYNVGRVGP